MASIVTPGQLAQRSDAYYQLHQLTSSGISILQALETQAMSPPARGWQPVFERLASDIRSGESLTSAAQAQAHWLSPFELALIESAEKSGRLAETFQTLAHHYRDKAALARQFLALVLYPVLVFHVAVLIFPLSYLQGLILQGDLVGFVVHKVMVLVPIYTLIWVAMFLGQEKRSAGWRSFLEGCFRCVPLLGVALRDLALARLSSALEALLSAGIPIIQSWKIAAPASGSPAMIRAIRRFGPLLNANATPGEAVQRSGFFPATFANHYSSGEVSGKLDESLKWLALFYQEEGSRKLKRAIMVAGGLIYGAVVLLVAWQVISFYIGYFNQINEVIPN